MTFLEVDATMAQFINLTDEQIARYAVPHPETGYIVDVYGCVANFWRRNTAQFIRDAIHYRNPQLTVLDTRFSFHETSRGVDFYFSLVTTEWPYWSLWETAVSKHGLYERECIVDVPGEITRVLKGTFPVEDIEEGIRLWRNDGALENLDIETPIDYFALMLALQVPMCTELREYVFSDTFSFTNINHIRGLWYEFERSLSWSDLLKLHGPTCIIDNWGDDVLLASSVKIGENVLFVRCSTKRDWHLIHVPGTLDSALEAVAWTFGVSPETYQKLEIQT